MRVLVLYAHPVADSFASSLHRTIVQMLRAAGHEVDDCDLYAEDFDPVLSAEEWRRHHDVPANRAAVEGYVDRVLAAEAIVLCYPVWNFGYPAILKGFFDRVFLPGVSFDLVDGKVRPSLRNIRKAAAVVTYGGSRWRAWLMGDSPRRLFKRVLRVTIRPGAPMTYLALYAMDLTTPGDRAAFQRRVEAAMRTF
ncbi:MAG: NAD(P)H-dependent oxidoreductase [Bauldia sp.]